jgi:hypothetical protein
LLLISALIPTQLEVEMLPFRLCGS